MGNGIGDVVVLIPGISGSVLERDGKEVWAPSAGAALRAVLSLGRSIKRLTLAGDDPAVDDLGDGVVATRVMPDLHLLPGLDWKIDGYTRFKRRMIENLGCVPGKNYFELPYDWRRDNRVAARKLARNAHDWLAAWRTESGNPDAKLVLVGHSMGGLVARLYLELLDGWRDTRSLITFGTPYSGSINALTFLENGFMKGWGPFTVDLSEMIRSFTSVYQLLPSYRCLAGPDDTWLNLDEVGWKGLDADRLADSLSVHRELRKAVDDRIKRGDHGYTVRPVIGSFQRTGWAARQEDGGIKALSMRALREEGGDGTVPMVSAAPHELLKGYQNASFVSQKHASLQNDDSVLDHAAGVVTSAEQSPIDVFPAEDEAVCLEVQDVSTDEPMVIRARPRQPATELVATLTPVLNGGSTRVPLIDLGDGWWRTELYDLPPADYRVTIGGDGARPVTDVVSVVDLTTLGD
ncbi:lipase/acyltransferase domain-containing protein [Kibdelosporangium aridum]|uniref:lipase/acyltransferase domain-containing protein n=1 Tax=Kibdelosporangium aridum TaxID=2030 RepID=UPI0035EC46B3